MAALAPPPFRPSPAPHTSTAPSSTSTTNSATPSKKQEQLAAGRRRLEEFKRKKAAEKGKKTSAASVIPSAAASDQPVQNVVDPGQISSVLPTLADSLISTSKEIDSNGHAAEDSRSNANSAKSSLPSELAAPSVAPKEPSGVLFSVSDDGHLSTRELFRKDPQVAAVPSGGSNDGSPIRGSHSNAWEQLTVRSSTTTLGSLDGESGSLSDHGSKSTNKTVASTAPLGAASPLFVPAPPVRKEIFGTFNSASVRAKPETTKNLETNSTSTLGPSSHTNDSSSLSLKSENEKGSDNPPINTSSSTLPPALGVKTSVKVSESSSFLHPPVSESAPPKYLPLPPPLLRPPISTSTLKSEPVVPPVFKSVFDSNYSANTSSRPLISTSTFKPETVVPPVYKNVFDSNYSTTTTFRPPISTSTFKPEPVVPPVFKSAFESNYPATTISPTAPSTSTVSDTALFRPSAPSTFQIPGPFSAVNAIHENGKPDKVGNPLTAVLSMPSSSVGEIRTQTIKVAEPADQPLQRWPPPSGGDDFSMLEQHIEDLTQEKFSLQRGLDAARTLAETLAKENSALTEDFNNQGALVNELKAESERQQGEIRAQAVVVKNMKGERDKAVQDSKAAVERSQALAAEVIALEEKVLRARSQELKLQREMELLNADTEAQKRQIVSLEKDRANLKTLMEALQEEKGLLQTQIRKATSGGDRLHPNSSSRASGSGAPAKTDAGTSTDDLGLETLLTLGQAAATGTVEPLEQQRRLPLIIPSLPSRPLPSPSHAGQTSGSSSIANEFGSASQSLVAAAGNLSGRSLNLGPTSSVLPPDQAATIGNINNLITELAEEKEALLKALRAESVGASELRTLNAELSHKLEVQTQRLELAVAQSMANDGTPRPGSTYAVSRMAPEFVDEGDEVVDRVLGWIMQLFPSGSSRRKRL